MTGFSFFFLTIFFQTGLVSIWVFGSALGGTVIFSMKLATVEAKMTEHTVVVNFSPH